MSKIQLNNSNSVQRRNPYFYGRKSAKKDMAPEPKIRVIPVDVSSKIDFDVNQNIQSTNIELKWLRECIDHRLKGKIFLKHSECVTIVTIFD